MFYVRLCKTVFCKSEDYTQGEFAQQLGYSEKTVSKWECEASIPAIETLFDIAKILQTSLDDLFQARDVYCLGIDGGGTKTDLALVDREGSLIRTLKVSGCNLVDIGFEVTKKLLKDAIYEICEDIPFSSIYLFAGIAGGTSAGMQKRFHDLFEEFHFRAFANDFDNKNIMAAGLGKRDGITLILGTGKKTALTKEIDAIYPGGAQKIMAYIYRTGKKAVASFSPAVFAAIEKQDEIAVRILERNIKEAVHIIETAAEGFTGEKIPVILAGGLTKQPSVLEGIKAMLCKPERFEFQILNSAPVNGAVMLAKELMEEEEEKNAGN